MLATVIETADLLRTALASLAAGVGVTAAFSLAILGASRLADYRRSEQPGLALIAGAAMLTGIAVTLASVVLGIVVMAS